MMKQEMIDKLRRALELIEHIKGDYQTYKEEVELEKILNELLKAVEESSV